MTQHSSRRVALGAAFLVVVGIGLAALIANEDIQPAPSPRSRSNFVRLLSLIPDTPETRVDLFMIDYDRLFDLLDVKRPASTHCN